MTLSNSFYPIKLSLKALSGYLTDHVEPLHYLILGGVAGDPGVDVGDDVNTNIAEKIIPRTSD